MLLVLLLSQPGHTAASTQSSMVFSAGPTNFHALPCPAGFKAHASGYWQNTIPGPPGHPNPAGIDSKNNTPALCGTKCKTWPAGCVAFEVSTDCYVFPKPAVVMPFTTYPPATTCVLDGYTPPLPPPPPPPCVLCNSSAACTAPRCHWDPTAHKCTLPPPPPPPPPYTPPPQRGRTTGHTFPRLSNCWGDDPYISDDQWGYAGFPHITNATWAEQDVLYLNPFDSCCWLKQMNDWVPRIKAIKAAKPEAVVLATFHATEIWSEDLIEANRWLPDSCLMRNADGSVCSWWVGLVFSNNLFRPECWQAAVDNAMHALEGGLLAGEHFHSVSPVNLQLRVCSLSNRILPVVTLYDQPASMACSSMEWCPTPSAATRQT